MNYIEQLDKIFAVNEARCKRFHKEAREQWKVLLELGFVEQDSPGGDCNLYAPTHAEQKEKAPGWPLLSKNGRELPDNPDNPKKRVLVQYSHGSSPAPISGIKKSMRTSLGVVIEKNRPDTIKSWYNATITALDRLRGNQGNQDLCQQIVEKYLKKEYPSLSFEQSIESLWLKSYSRPEVTAQKIIESGIDPSRSEEDIKKAQEAQIMAEREAALQRMAGGAKIMGFKEIDDLARAGAAALMGGDDVKAFDISERFRELLADFNKNAKPAMSARERDAVAAYTKKLISAEAAALSPSA